MHATHSTGDEPTGTTDAPTTERTKLVDLATDSIDGTYTDLDVYSGLVDATMVSIERVAEGV